MAMRVVARIGQLQTTPRMFIRASGAARTLSSSSSSFSSEKEFSSGSAAAAAPGNDRRTGRLGAGNYNTGPYNNHRARTGPDWSPSHSPSSEVFGAAAGAGAGAREGAGSGSQQPSSGFERRSSSSSSSSSPRQASGSGSGSGAGRDTNRRQWTPRPGAAAAKENVLEIRSKLLNNYSAQMLEKRNPALFEHMVARLEREAEERNAVRQSKLRSGPVNAAKKGAGEEEEEEGQGSGSSESSNAAAEESSSSEGARELSQTAMKRKNRRFQPISSSASASSSPSVSSYSSSAAAIKVPTLILPEPRYGVERITRAKLFEKITPIHKEFLRTRFNPVNPIPPYLEINAKNNMRTQVTTPTMEMISNPLPIDPDILYAVYRHF